VKAILLPQIRRWLFRPLPISNLLTDLTVLGGESHNSAVL